MRRIAGFLALAVAVVQLAAAVVTEVQSLGLLDPGATGSLPPAWTRLPVVLAALTPWIVGGVLLLRRCGYLGTAVIVPLGALELPRILLVADWVLDLLRERNDALDAVALIGATASLLIWALAVVAGALAWRSRPRSGWRSQAPERRNLYTVLAFMAWLPSILASTQLLVPSAAGTSLGARRFVEALWTNAGGLNALAGVVGALLLGLALVVAPGLRRDAAGLMAIMLLLPWLTTQIATLVAVGNEPLIIATPSAWLGTVGAAGVVVLGSRWLREGRRGSLTPRAGDVPEDTDPEETGPPRS